MWKHAILNPSYGLLNGTLTWVWGLFGSDNTPQPAWLTEWPLLSIELSLIWQWTPFMMLILLAGLQSMPKDAVEAARIDGAAGPQIFRYLTLPHLRRYIELSVILGARSEEHTSELQSRGHLVCRLLLEKKKQKHNNK